MRATTGAVLALAAIAVVAVHATPSRAEYPDKPVTLVVPFPPGGSTGYTAKVLADELTRVLGQPFTLETRTGNYGITALEALVGKTDGTTLMVGSIITNSMTPVLHRADMKFDYDAEIAPVSRLADFPSVVMTQVAVPADNVKDFLAYLQKKSGKLRFGTDFLGTFVDVDAIMLGKSAGLKVSYHATNGATGILNDLVEGRIDIAILNVATASANIGKFKPLAVTGRSRLANFPTVPTLAEAGYEGIGTPNWQGLFAPRGITAPAVRTLFDAVGRAMHAPAALEAFAKVNAGVATSESPEKFAAEVKAEMTKWEKVIPEVMALPQE
jgi:tripartite-type tricarboxylate transporter receptor subunit TctC